MKVYDVPVAFSIKANSETEAAEYLSHELAWADLIRPHNEVEIESWWLPNNPAVDNSDRTDPKLIWVEHGVLERLLKNSND